MAVKRRISVNNLREGLSFRAGEVRELFRHLDRVMAPDAVPPGELSIAIVGRGEIVRMHVQFLGDPAVTDVITFPGDPDEDLAGEICVCADFALEQAPRFSQDFSSELALYLAHGWLHLAGYDDIAEEDRPRMREGEKRAMNSLREAGLIPHFSLASD
jgi:probable rRNA maturation factor